jgi:hypothetical protein
MAPKREKVTKVTKLHVLNENPDNSISKRKEIDLTASWLGCGGGGGVKVVGEVVVGGDGGEGGGEVPRVETKLREYQAPCPGDSIFRHTPPAYSRKFLIKYLQTDSARTRPASCVLLLLESMYTIQYKYVTERYDTHY